MKIYPLDVSKEGLDARKLAIFSSSLYVLKPQREGGGHNIYRSSIPPFLETETDDAYYNSYIFDGIDSGS